MLAVGNVRARQIYEATCPCWYLRPSVDQDSSIVRENWIRAKYERREFLADVKHPLAVSTMPEKPKEGYLWKANKKGVWQKRFTMLHGRFLYYFKSPSDSYPKGIIDVCELTFKLPHGPDQNKRYVFEAHTTKRAYPFGADTVADMLDWVHALKRAAAYYITMMHSDVAPDGMNALATLAFPNEQEVVKLSFQQMGEPLKLGFLQKQGGQWKTWKKRLCVVTDTTLFYFKKDRPAPADLPEGGIPLDQCYVMNGDSKAEKKCCISLVTPGRVYFLVANNEQELQEWQDVLSQVTERLNPPRYVDFSQMEQPAPVRSQLGDTADDSD